ncbi:MAG TPA: hypothetical protein VH878_04895 [Thermodesulfobacteriota bacterium]
MDWEEFKRETASLNKPRTEEERLQLFHNAALESWAESEVTDDSLALPVRKAGEPKTPAPLKILLEIQIRRKLFIYYYVKLLVSMTDKGIYPVRWNNEVRQLRDYVIDIRVADVGELVKCIYEHYAREEDEMKNLTTAFETYVKLKKEKNK